MCETVRIRLAILVTTVSGANSHAQETSSENPVFDALLGTDGELDNLFG